MAKQEQVQRARGSFRSLTEAQTVDVLQVHAYVRCAHHHGTLIRVLRPHHHGVTVSDLVCSCLMT